MTGDFVGFVPRAREHFRDALFRRQDDGQFVGPVVVEKELLEIVLAVGID